MKNNVNNHKKRHFYDGLLQTFTYLSSGISVLVLVALFVFIFSKGWSLINLDLLTNNYWSENYTVQPVETMSDTTFERPANLSEEAYFSEKWGIAFVDHVDAHKDKMILVEYVDENSPLYQMSDVSIKKDPKDFTMQVGMQISRLSYTDAQGKIVLGGSIAGEDAKQLAQSLDEDAVAVNSIFVQTTGGGIRGSIISTLYLLAVSMIIAIPIGIASAIYLNEYAKKSKFNMAAAQRHRNLDRCAKHRFRSDGCQRIVPGHTVVRCDDDQHPAGRSDYVDHPAADHHSFHRRGTAGRSAAFAVTRHAVQWAPISHR